VCPRTCRTEGAAKCTYWRWSSRTPRQQVHLRIFRQRHSARRIGSYLRFRLGCSTLPVVMGRRDHTPRHRRHCQQCDAAVVGDKRHMIFECPAVQHIRDQNPDLFWDDQSMREFVNQADQVAVMDFIVACFDSFVQTRGSRRGEDSRLLPLSRQISLAGGFHPVNGTLLARSGLATRCNIYPTAVLFFFFFFTFRRVPAHQSSSDIRVVASFCAESAGRCCVTFCHHPS